MFSGKWFQRKNLKTTIGEKVQVNSVLAVFAP